MSAKQCAPVAVFLYNRPEYSAELIRRVEDANPSRLYLVFDAPNPSVPGDERLCDEVFCQWWPLIQDSGARDTKARVHLGCRDRVSSGLDWLFEHESEAIILEDDLLPSHSFFSFCTEALERYRDDFQVMAVTGCNFGWACPPDRPYFSTYSHVWGWATWRRAWRFYDRHARAWRALHGPAALDMLLRDRSRAVRAHWSRLLEMVSIGALDTWDFQWQLAIWLRSGMVVGPAKNLVSNIGIGPNATHTKGPAPLLRLATHEIDLPVAWAIDSPSAVDAWFDSFFIVPNA